MMLFQLLPTWRHKEQPKVTRRVRLWRPAAASFAYCDLREGQQSLIEGCQGVVLR